MKEKEKENTWGGARPGCGRKSIDPEEKRVQMGITIDKETRDRLKAIAKAKHITPGRVIDQIIKGMIC